MEILLVDDDVHVRESLTAVLQSEDHGVSTASNAAEALHEVSNADARYDAVLLDIWLGEDDGLQVLKSIRSDHPDLPVIIMSGGGPGKSLEHALALADTWGAFETLIKPFKNHALLNALNTIGADA